MATAEVTLSKCHLLKLNLPVCTQQPCFLFTQSLSSAKGKEWLMGEESYGERHSPPPSSSMVMVDNSG